jgi:hypothetical protein
VAAKNSKRQRTPRPGQVFGKNGVFFSFPHGDQEQIQVTVDFGLVPPPANYYYADSLYIRMDREQRMAILSFGLRNENTNKFSTRIDIVMPIKSLTGPFWTSSRPVEATLDKVLELAGLVGETRPISPPDADAITLFANMIFWAVGDGESTLDFHHLPPREIHLAKSQRKDIQLQPTVRVILSTTTTKHFFNTLRPYTEGAAESLPVQERSRRAARSR